MPEERRRGPADVPRDPDCVFCERSVLHAAEVYLENEYCIYASSRDPSDPPGVLPGSGIVVPKAHRASPFDLTPAEWAALRPLLLEAKAIQDARLAPDGYFLSWTSFPASDAEVGSMHAHLHVVPRFDDEPLRHRGGRVGIKGPENRRPDPTRAGTGRARRFGATA
jgi:diadenosine tetraphosphate (Ap4A) HIT family hydrolase